MIGALRHRVTLQQAVRTPDEGGGADLLWTDIASVWASIEAAGGSVRDASDRIDTRTRTKIRLRFRAGINPGMRFIEGSRIFNIQAVLDENGKRQWLLCLCEEGETS